MYIIFVQFCCLWLQQHDTKSLDLIIIVSDCLPDFVLFVRLFTCFCPVCPIVCLFLSRLSDCLPVFVPFVRLFACFFLSGLSYCLPVLVHLSLNLIIIVSDCLPVFVLFVRLFTCFCPVCPIVCLFLSGLSDCLPVFVPFIRLFACFFVRFVLLFACFSAPEPKA